VNFGAKGASVTAAVDGEQSTARRRHRFRLSHRAQRRLGWTAAIIVFVAVVIAIVLRSTPWPSAMVIRAVFERGGAQTVEEMTPYVPDAPLAEHLDVQYSDGSAGADTTLDVFSPGAGAEPLPTVVWVHGGAWISGSKENVDPYLRILANEGYTTVGLNYTVGPEATYPTAVRQLNEALGYLNDHAAELGIDPDRIVLAGDSAGSQLASQLAVLITNPDYETLVGIEPAIAPDQLAGIVLNCGVFDLQGMADLGGLAGWGFKTALWAYTGEQDWSNTAQATLMSSMEHVTSDFPATFITGGNGDGLTWLQSVPMHRALQAADVDVTALFWAEEHEPALPHEYQFHLAEFDEAHTALAETVAFLGRVTAD
jgi:acetyl esterase/lipase